MYKELIILIVIIIIIIIITQASTDSYHVLGMTWVHPVVEFRRGIMRLPFAATTSRSPLSKV